MAESNNIYILVKDPSVWSRFNDENDCGFQLAKTKGTRFYDHGCWDDTEWKKYPERLAEVLQSDGVVLVDGFWGNSGAFEYSWYLGKKVGYSGLDSGPYITGPVEWLNKLNLYWIDDEEKQLLFDCGILVYDRKFVEYDKRFQYREDVYLRETSLAGRPDIIENTSLGEKLFFVLREDDKDDPQCIEVRCERGSLGVLPSDVADYLLPLFTKKHLIYSAKIVELIKLSQRNKHARSPIVAIRISASFSKDIVDDVKAGIRNEVVTEKREQKAYGVIDKQSSDLQQEKAPVVKESERHITEPAARSGKRQYVKVHFEDNKSYTYSCDYVIALGDPVMVEGTRAGSVGTVEEILATAPNANTLRFMKAVTKVLKKHAAVPEKDAQKALGAAESVEKEKAEAERIASEKAEAERIAKEKAERKAQEAEEARRKKREEEQKAREREEAERKKAVKAAERKAREEAERKQQEETERKKAEKEAARKQQEAVEQYEKDHAAWETACEEALKNQENFVRERLDEEKSRLKDEAKQERNLAVNSANAAIADHTQRKAQAEKTLASLGLFSFSEKKRQKAIIEESSRLLTETQQSLPGIETAYQSRLAFISKQISEMESSVRFEAKKKFPLPDEPKKPKAAVKREKNAASRLSAEEKKVLAILQAAGEEMTATAVAEKIGGEIFIQRVSKILLDLVEKGFAIKTIRLRRSYFEAI